MATSNALRLLKDKRRRAVAVAGTGNAPAGEGAPSCRGSRSPASTTGTTWRPLLLVEDGLLTRRRSPRSTCRRPSGPCSRPADTGTGDPRDGEGSAGLRRASRLLAPATRDEPWKVDDQATSRLDGCSTTRASGPRPRLGPGSGEAPPHAAAPGRAHDPSVLLGRVRRGRRLAVDRAGAEDVAVGVSTDNRDAKRRRRIDTE